MANVKTDLSSPIGFLGHNGSSPGKITPQQALTLLGIPEFDGYVFGDWFLRQTRMKTRQLKLGETSQFVIAMIGDSWIDGRYFTTAMATALQEAFGVAGVGWVGFPWFGTASGSWVDGGTQPIGVQGCVRDDLVTAVTIHGAWVADYNNAATSVPGLSVIASSTAGNYVSFDFTAGHTGARLFYVGGGSGVIRHSWDGGSGWESNTSLDAAAEGSVALSNVPSGAATLTIEIVSGTVTLAGVDMTSDSDGVRVHGIAGSGTASAVWAGADIEDWGAQLADLSPDLIIALLGTNDQSGSVTAAAFGDNATTIMSGLRTALPAADLLWVQPPENARTDQAVPMVDYALAARGAATAGRWAFLDLQYVFGDEADDYKHGSARPWLREDMIHPVNATGGRAIADAILRVMCPSI